MSTNQNASFVVVSNRLPVDRVTNEDGQLILDDNGEATWQMSPGGLVTALEPVMSKRGGAWIGWPGSADETVEPFDFDNYKIVPVSLTSDDVKEYYEGMSNATIWPLYHDVIAVPEYHREWWERYRLVNQKFADAVAQIAEQGSVVWVQDYQLQLVPALLRAKRPDLKIGFFLHIPFPPIELFMQLPWRSQILEGLLGADIVGFQVEDAAQNFVALANKLGLASGEGERLRMPDGREVLVRAYPISLDSQGLLELSRTGEVAREHAKLLSDLGSPRRIFFGVDRLDYTKGLRHRVRAFGELFEEGKLDANEDVYVQLATPSRERVRDYQILHEQLDGMVSRINSQSGSLGRPPIQYLYTSVPKLVLTAMYRMADVCVVTPLRDGMNLVAKEYVVAHDSDAGALVLSEFAGAAGELADGAYMVNPYDLNGMKRQLMRAIEDAPEERARRMQILRDQVLSHDISAWADKFLMDMGVNISNNKDATI